MPNQGDSFITVLKRAHLEWGTYRYTNSRGYVYGEGYLQIPKQIARNLRIYNSNQIGANTEYTCSTADNFLNNCIIKASGSSNSGDIYAKQFQGSGNLRLLGDWFYHINASMNDKIKITWLTPTNILLQKMP